MIKKYIKSGVSVKIIFKLILPAVLILMFAAGCSNLPFKIINYLFMSGVSSSGMPHEYGVYKVKKAHYDIELKTSGSLECINELSITVPNGIWGARIEKLSSEGVLVNSGEVICALNTTSIEDGLNRALNELSNSENELEDFKLENELKDMSKKIQIMKKDIQYEVSLFKLNEIRKGADTVEIAISNIGIEKNKSFIKNFESKLNLQKELLKKGFLSSFQFAELELEYQRNILELEQNYNKLEMLEEIPLPEEIKKNETSVEKLEFDRKLTLNEYEASVKLDRIEKEKKELGINEKKHKVAQAQAVIDKAIIQAPIGGTLLYSASWNGKTRVGMEVWSGLDILKIVDLQNMKIIAKINEKYIDHFKEGARVNIVLNSQPDITLKGMVHSISKLARLKDELDPKGPREFDVTVYFKETSEIKLIPDMSADIGIISESFDNVSRVPKDFVENGDLTIISPVKKKVQVKAAKTEAVSLSEEKWPVLAAEDMDYYYFMNCPDEFSVLIPQKGSDTLENGI